MRYVPALMSLRSMLLDVPRLAVPVDDVEVDGDLREEDRIGLGSHAAAEGRVAGVATEDLDDHDPVVRAAGGLEVVGEIGDAVDRRVAADAIRLQVEVHGLGGMHALDALSSRSTITEPVSSPPLITSPPMSSLAKPCLIWSYYARP